MIHDLFSKPLIVFGCGNTLVGDDGFGPRVIEHLLERYPLPDSVAAVDAGTSIGGILLDYLLSKDKPAHIFIVDAISRSGRSPGELFELRTEDIPDNKVSNFSLHQFPSVNLLRELEDEAGVGVHILAVQVKEVPEIYSEGLSPEVQAAIPGACAWLVQEIDKAIASGSQAEPPILK